MTGSTACVVFITSEAIYCANAGDSRAVLKSGDHAVALSVDHKPDNKKERKRIKKANHNVKYSRVDEDLALSRAFGDFLYKDQKDLKPEQQAITCLPDVVRRNRRKLDKFIVLACDGIWDCLSNDEIVE